MDKFIVRHVEGHNDSGYLRRYGNGATVRIGIIGRLNVTRRKPIIDAAADQQQENEETAKQYVTARVGRSVSWLLFRLRLVGRLARLRFWIRIFIGFRPRSGAFIDR